MAAASAKAEIGSECTRRVSDAHIAAIGRATTAAGPKQRTRAPIAEDSDTTLETPQRSHAYDFASAGCFKKKY